MEIIKNIQAQIKSQDSVHELLNALPELPSTIRYYDNFNEQIRSIKNFNIVRILDLQITGETHKIFFDNYDDEIDVLAKHLFLYLITENLSTSTALARLVALYAFRRQTLVTILETKPVNFITLWSNLLSDNNFAYLFSIKLILYFLANYHLSGWSPPYNSFISSLPTPFQDKFASVRKGDVFLDMQEEAKIVEFLDNAALYLKNKINTDDLNSCINAGIVLCSYQFGMRPVQIALLSIRDIRVWNDSIEAGTNVHLSFKNVKQRTKTTSRYMLRKVKKEWTPIFLELLKKNLEAGMAGNDKFFRISSAQKLNRRLNKCLRNLLGRSVTATDIRHTGAQRMVDGGASQEELAEFMGHTDITTGLVYFQTSANQAERVNQALGISPIYQQVIKIAHDKFISIEELSELKGAHQIAAVPHGIPIAGIGACSSGQPACPFNPVTSCYGCRKFMPLQDVAIHQQVLKEMREVVGFFITEAKGDPISPTYLQLQNTISGVQQIIAEIERVNHA